MDLVQELSVFETRVWAALAKGDGEADKALLSDDFLGIYSDGFAGRDGHVDQLASGPSVSQFALSDLQARPLGSQHAVLSYRADFLKTGRSESETMYVSSIWRRHGDGWINILSQDTVATS